MKHLKLFSIVLSMLLLWSCGSGINVISTPVEKIDKTPLKISEPTEAELHHWGHLDLVKDTIPGMSVDKAYNKIINDKKGKSIIVAVIDSGIDIDHEDLSGNIWVNTDEVAGNKKDDDNNGYVDDIHGWNFLGDAYDEQLEMTRIVATNNTEHPDYAKAKEELENKYAKALAGKQQYEQILQQLKAADKTVSEHLKKTDYTAEDVAAIKTTDPALLQAKETLQFLYGNGLESVAEAKEELTGAITYYSDQLNYNLNKDFRGRKTGDNIADITDTGYGNGNVKPAEKGESHGTHVAGIIAAKRNNGKGVNGVANNVKIMSLRAVPNGDEYDKDIALAIRYAVDNGAKVINGSFGKSYSTHSDWVRSAIKYAADKDVVIVHAAGNDGNNIDVENNYPDDNVNNGPEVADNFISVGALEPDYGADIVASFSNYGKNNVDIFAPGAEIYSTMPNNEYKSQGGTSMASPAVAGVAALIRSYYPTLNASQVKQIILNSGLPININVVVGGDANTVKPFADLSKSGKIVNAYNALILAAQTAK